MSEENALSGKDVRELLDAFVKQYNVDPRAAEEWYDLAVDRGFLLKDALRNLVEKAEAFKREAKSLYFFAEETEELRVAILKAKEVLPKEIE